MKITLAIACALVLAAPAAMSAGPNYGCDAINFSDEVMAKMPNAKRCAVGSRRRTTAST